MTIYICGVNHYSQNLIRDNPPCECVVASLGGIFFFYGRNGDRRRNETSLH